jgi:hypothetical protein
MLRFQDLLGVFCFRQRDEDQSRMSRGKIVVDEIAPMKIYVTTQIEEK